MPELALTTPILKDSAIWGRAVVITVPSRFSIKKAVATMSGAINPEVPLFFIMNFLGLRVYL
jgi:hypothetical protein